MAEVDRGADQRGGQLGSRRCHRAGMASPAAPISGSATGQGAEGSPARDDGRLRNANEMGTVGGTLRRRDVTNVGGCRDRVTVPFSAALALPLASALWSSSGPTASWRRRKSPWTRAIEYRRDSTPRLPHRSPARRDHERGGRVPLRLPRLIRPRRPRDRPHRARDGGPRGRHRRGGAGGALHRRPLRRGRSPPRGGAREFPPGLRHRLDGPSGSRQRAHAARGGSGPLRGRAGLDAARRVAARNSEGRARVRRVRCLSVGTRRLCGAGGGRAGRPGSRWRPAALVRPVPVASRQAHRGAPAGRGRVAHRGRWTADARGDQRAGQPGLGHADRGHHRCLAGPERADARRARAARGGVAGPRIAGHRRRSGTPRRPPGRRGPDDERDWRRPRPRSNAGLGGHGGGGALRPPRTLGRRRVPGRG